MPTKCFLILRIRHVDKTKCRVVFSKSCLVVPENGWGCPQRGKKRGETPGLAQESHLCSTKIQHFSAKSKSAFSALTFRRSRCAAGARQSPSDCGKRENRDNQLAFRVCQKCEANFFGGSKKIFFVLLSDIKRLPYLCRRKAVPHLRAGEKGTPCNSATVPAAVTPFVVPKRLKTTAIKLFAGRCSESGEARKPAAFGTSALASGATPR